MSRAIENFEIVDLSRGKEARGFDITGHHYWYRNPWASSDIIFLLRTDLPSHRRGLTPSKHRQVYYFGPGYPEAAREAIRRELSDQWSERVPTRDPEARSHDRHPTFRRCSRAFQFGKVRR